MDIIIPSKIYDNFKQNNKENCISMFVWVDIDFLLTFLAYKPSLGRKFTTVTNNKRAKNNNWLTLFVTVAGYPVSHPKKKLCRTVTCHQQEHSITVQTSGTTDTSKTGQNVLKGAKNCSKYYKIIGRYFKRQ